MMVIFKQTLTQHSGREFGSGIEDWAFPLKCDTVIPLTEKITNPNIQQGTLLDDIWNEILGWKLRSFPLTQTPST